MRFGLYGIYGTYNFGCEAIVRGTYAFLKNKYPNCEIFYYSYCYAYDSSILSDLDIKIIEVKYTKNILKKILNKLFSALHFKAHLLMIDYKSILNNVDTIVSIGGDIYTIPEHLRKQKKYRYYNSLIHFCNVANKMKKEVVVYGASVGPWGDYSKAVNYYKRAMIKYKAIVCREMKSVDYLTSLGFNNVSFSPDPAFSVKSTNAKPRKRRYIGFNFSPLSFNEVNGSLGLETTTSLANLLDLLYEEYHIDFLLIPHVLSKTCNDNDLLFLESVREKMKYSNNVSIADCSRGFLGIKNQLRDCMMVVSARMHCAINAIVEGIPTLFLAYSQKSFGMCEYVYGNLEYVVGIKDVFQLMPATFNKMFSNLDSIEHQIQKRLIEIENSVCD